MLQIPPSLRSSAFLSQQREYLMNIVRQVNFTGKTQAEQQNYLTTLISQF